MCTHKPVVCALSIWMGTVVSPYNSLLTQIDGEVSQTSSWAPAMNGVKLASMWISSAAEQGSVYRRRPLFFCVSYPDASFSSFSSPHVFVLQAQAKDPYSAPAQPPKWSVLQNVSCSIKSKNPGTGLGSFHKFKVIFVQLFFNHTSSNQTMIRKD